MQSNNAIVQCWLNKNALEQMIHFADNKYALETGGILVGYISKTGEPVILGVIGPGPGAKHFSFRFIPDHDWQCEQLDICYESSQGKIVYLGDWHTHPNGTPDMSWIDKRTLMRIAQHSASCLTRPLMLIGAGTPNTWKWACHQHITGKFFNFVSHNRRLNILRFS